jgi:hypothetical protein
MKRAVLLLLMLVFSAVSYASAQTTPVPVGHVPVYNSDVPTKGGLRGLHIDRSTQDNLPNGIAFDYGGQFAWGMGLDCTMDYTYPIPPFQLPDLVLAYSAHTDADNLRIRSDDARMELGPMVGHPVTPFQFAIKAGTQANPLGGVSIGTFGYQYSIHMYNQDPTVKRTCVNFANLWSWGTDLAQNGGSDLFLYNHQNNHPTITVISGTGTADDVIGLSGTLQHQGHQAGFFGAAPTAQPVVTGSWSDGSAARSLCQALAKLGLIQDQTTQ